MKLTAQRLKRLIREELNKFNESEGYYGNPEQVMSMDKIMSMFDVENGNEETARQASEIAVLMGLGDEVLNQLFSMLAAMKMRRQKGRNMFQHDEYKMKLETFIEILQQAKMESDQSRPPMKLSNDDDDPLDV